MADLNHMIGNDLALSPSGDLSSVDGPTRGLQRVLRRLCTNGGAYIWHLTYGAGLPRRVGDKLDTSLLTAVVRSQILLEPAVARDPRPQVTVQPFLNGASVEIVYVNSETGSQETLAFDVSDDGNT